MKFKEFYDILLEANADKRIEYIRKKYGPALESLLDSYLSTKPSENQSVLFKNMFRMDFPEHIVKTIDPFEGIYSDWITRCLLKQPFNNNTFYRFLTEDFYKVSEDLQKYHKYKYLFKKLGEELNNPNTIKLADINQIKSFDHLYETLKLLNHLIEDEEEKESLKAAEKDVEKIYDSTNYLILIPKTQQASCAYGRGTRWCIASTGSYNYFDSYNRGGPLYIIIDKNQNRKFQFHFQSKQFMNEDDTPLNMSSFFDEHLEIKNILLNLAFVNEDYDFIVNHDQDFLIEKFETIESTYSRQVIVKNNFLIAVRLSEKHREFVNNSQSLFTINDDEKVFFNTDATGFSDLVDFIKDENGRYGISRKYATEILDGTNHYFFDSLGYDKHFWDWLDEKSEKLIIKYTKQNYSADQIVENIKDAKEILDDNGDDVIKTCLTSSFDYVYESSYSNEIYNAVQSAITNVLGKDYFWNGNLNNYLSFKWTKKDLFSLAKDLQKSSNENDESGPNCDWSSVYTEWVRMLDDSNDLESVNLDRVGGYPTKKEYGDEFNSRFQELLDEEILEENELDLSSINRIMNNFDAYIYKLWTEDLANMGKGGLTNRTSTSNQPSQTSMKSGFGMKPAASKPSSNSNTADKGISISIPQNNLDDVLLNPNTNFDEILKDPNNQQPLFNHISTSLMDPQYKNKDKLQTLLKNNTNLATSYNNFINNVQ